MAVSTLGGTASSSAVMVTHKVPAMKGLKPNKPSSGFHTWLESNCHREWVLRSGQDLDISMPAIKITSPAGRTEKIKNNRPACRSLLRREARTFSFPIFEEKED